MLLKRKLTIKFEPKLKTINICISMWHAMPWCSECANNVCSCDWLPDLRPSASGYGCEYAVERDFDDSCTSDQDCVWRTQNTSLCLSGKCRCPQGAYRDENKCKYSQ